MSTEESGGSRVTAASPRAGRRFRRVLLFAVAVVAVALVTRRLSNSEPRYQGLRFSRVIELRQPEVAVQAAYQIGPETALPYFVEALEREDSVLNQFTINVWARLPARWKSQNMNRMPMPAESTRVKALTALMQMGPDARPALPAVIRMTTAALTNARTYPLYAGLAALGEIGFESAEALPPLLAALQSSIAAVSQGAAMSLFYFGKLAAPAVPFALQGLKDGDTARLSAASFVLSGVGSNATEAVPVLAAALEDDRLAPTVASVLRRFGPVASPAVPGLTRIIERRGTNYVHAIEALMNIGPQAKAAVPALDSLAGETNALVRILAAMALARIEEKPARALPVLVEFLRTPGKPGRSTWSPPFSDPRRINIAFNPQTTAAWFLGELGPAAFSARPDLLTLLTSKDSWLVAVAARSLWQIDGRGDEAVSALIRKLGDRSDMVWMLSARFLAEIGAEAAPALPHLRELRTQELRWPVRRAVNDAIRTIDSAAGSGARRGEKHLSSKTAATP